MTTLEIGIIFIVLIAVIAAIILFFMLKRVPENNEYDVTDNIWFNDKMNNQN